MDPGGEEAIAAVQDEEQFYGDEDDLDELYNDVNVGEGFLLSSIQSEEPAPEAGPPTLPPPPLPPVAWMPEKVHVTAVADEERVDRPSGVFEHGFRGGGDEMAAVATPPPPLSVRPELGQNPARDDDSQGQTGGSGIANGGFQRQGGGFGGVVMAGVNINGGGAGERGFGGATLFVGELHWWTTDAQLEEELCKYGQVKEVKFFEEKASGKSKGYCQVDFYDPMAAAAFKDSMNGHLFNGRPCVVAHASPATVRRMGEAQLKNNNLAAQPPPGAAPSKGRGGGVGGAGDGGGQQMGGNYGRGGGGSGNGGWGRGGMGNRGQMGNARNRMGPAGGRGIMGNGAMVAPPAMMHSGPTMGQGFDPTGYGATMGRMAGAYGGFPAGPAAAPFPGMMLSFPPGVNPHMNPAFFGRGGMPPGAGGVGMWPGPDIGGWAGEEQASYWDDAASEQHYGEAKKERASERDRSGASDRRHQGLEEEKMMGHGQEFSDRHYEDRELSRERDREKSREKVTDRKRERERDRDREREREREREIERERYRDDRDRHGDHRHRHRDRQFESSDDRDRAQGRSSRPRSKSRELEYSRRRRLSPA